MRALLIFAILTIGLLTPPIHAMPDNHPSKNQRIPTPEWLKMVDLGKQDPRLKGYQAPEGIKVEIVAENPVVANPIGITFATDGTITILESGSEDGRQSNRVKILRAIGGKGIYDKAEVVIADEPLSAILWHEGWLYCADQGTVYRRRSSKPDGPFDIREIVAKGFASSSKSAIGGMTIGPDGWLYIIASEESSKVEGADGSQATALFKGRIFRCWPDGSRIHRFAEGFRHHWGNLAFDIQANCFHSDAMTTGSHPTHVVEGMDFGWRSRSAQRTRNELRQLTGFLIYNDTQFPEHYRDLHYYSDAASQTVRAYRVAANGSGFDWVESFDLLSSSDPDFHPSQMVIGPDGSMILADHGGLENKNKGRIYRLSWEGTSDEPAIPLRDKHSWSRVASQKQQGLIQSLASPDATIREVAQKTLRQGNASCREGLLELIKNLDTDDKARIAAMGVLPAFWNAEVAAVCEELLQQGNVTTRRLAAEALGLNAPAGAANVQATLVKALADDDPTVRRAIILAMGRLNAPGGASALVNALAFDDGKDRILRGSLVAGIDMLGKSGIEQLLILADSGVDKDLDRTVETIVDLRSQFAADAVVTLLKNPHLKIAQRASLIQSFKNHLVDPQFSLNPLMDYLISSSTESSAVKMASMEVIAAATEGQRNPRVTDWLLKLLIDSDPGLQSSALKTLWIYYYPRGILPFWQ